MPENQLDTNFDTPDRTPLENILVEHDDLKRIPVIQQILEGFPEFAIVLNENRQVVAYNSKGRNIVTIASLSKILGLRVGEIFDCTHKDDDPNGCGTTRFCTQCGAAKSMMITRTKFDSNFEECRIISNAGGKNLASNLLVHTTPIELEGKKYTIFAIRDISSDKRREVLERIFFHDVLNTSGVVRGIASLIQNVNDENETKDLLSILLKSSEQLVEEILSQRDLQYAEKGDLVLEFTKIKVNEALNIAYDLYRNHRLSDNKIFTVEQTEDNIEIETDFSLLVRSLGNLIKNALEASGSGDEIKIYATHDGSTISFHVFNNKVITPNIQMQIFQMSFSTKSDKGHGIGTYSVKLIVEQYLKGKVSFVSDKTNKTIFTITLPKTKSIS
ncbi:sensor histidine kinase [Bacteroidota bacterium]